MSSIRSLIGQRHAHPARTVVLLPYVQLMPVAKRLWAQEMQDGFAPRFETTMDWAGRAGFAPGDDDLSFDMGRDLLTARTWLDRAGLGARGEMLAGRLVDAAWQLGALAGAVAPADRAAWA
ncbi:MAG: PD-(D/E)XK nuclease family protein, partial [Ramlibacter sp.]|nr:PD-(D/E)XK nuclease family protein [Ramlibacter sp.]